MMALAVLIVMASERVVTWGLESRGTLAFVFGNCWTCPLKGCAATKGYFGGLKRALHCGKGWIRRPG